MSWIRPLLVLSCFALAAMFLLAQGDLDPPPGPPTPLMKNLQQIEPRIDLDTVPGDPDAQHVITQPGSYYLSNRLMVEPPTGIRIASSHVTIDLMGFPIMRPDEAPAGGTAILIAGDKLTNIAITNGQIASGVTYNPAATGDQFTGSGFADGIALDISGPDSYPSNVRVSHLAISGCDNNGIILGEFESTCVEHCLLDVIGGFGIEAGQVHHCVARTCGGGGILAHGNASHCDVRCVSGTGLRADNVMNCTVFTQGGIGISAASNVSNSFGGSTEANGISASTVSHSHGSSSGSNPNADGIEAATVNFSYGEAIGGVEINATIAVGCQVFGGETITNKYLMP